LIFPEISLAGDGMLSALEVLRVIRETGQPLSTLANGFTRFPQQTINVPVARKPKLETVPALHTAMQHITQALGERGRLLVRYSGTENLARVMVEAEQAEDVQRYASELAELVKAELG
jgi:phosphoglucosamine mutase